jgi:hypothetical protein
MERNDPPFNAEALTYQVKVFTELIDRIPMEIAILSAVDPEGAKLLIHHLEKALQDAKESCE